MPVSEPEKKAETVSNRANRLNNSHIGVSSNENLASNYLRLTMVYKFRRIGNRGGRRTSRQKKVDNST